LIILLNGYMMKSFEKNAIKYLFLYEI